MVVVVGEGAGSFGIRRFSLSTRATTNGAAPDGCEQFSQACTLISGQRWRFVNEPTNVFGSAIVSHTAPPAGTSIHAALGASVLSSSNPTIWLVCSRVSFGAPVSAALTAASTCAAAARCLSNRLFSGTTSDPFSGLSRGTLHRVVGGRAPALLIAVRVEPYPIVPTTGIVSSTGVLVSAAWRQCCASSAISTDCGRQRQPTSNCPLGQVSISSGSV